MGTHTESAHHVFLTGATGYIGRALVQTLVDRGHTVRALVRQGREHRLPSGVTPVVGDALDATSYARHVAPADTFVQLVGTPHPGPGKATEFARVDLPSGLASVDAALVSGVRHLVYVSVAQPAPVMRDYVAVRATVEARIMEAVNQSALTATILRPWYVLGPGHRWPLALVPFYALGRLLPATRASAERLGLVTHGEMIRAIVDAVETPQDESVRVWDVMRIRSASR